MLSYFLGDRKLVIVHQGDLEYRFDSASVMGTSLTGYLHPPEVGKTGYPDPDTIVGIHPWIRKKRAPWMKACHIYVHDKVEMPMGFIYFWPGEIRVVRSFDPGDGHEIERQKFWNSIASEFAGNLFKSLLMLPFSSSSHGYSGGSFNPSNHTPRQPKGPIGSIQQAKVRTFPKQ
jgi:hypothetical protein